MIVLAPIVIPFAVLAGLLKSFGAEKSEDLSAAEVAGYIRDFVEGTGGAWDWDAFENMILTDPALEAIRVEACRAGPSNADMATLRGRLAKAEALG